MSNTILMAVDGSERGYQAVALVGRFCKGHPDMELLLFHCVPQLAGLLPGELAMGMDPCRRLSAGDREEVGKSVFGECMRRLVESGFPRERVRSRVRQESSDIAYDIQLEAEQEGIGTIAVGRRGRSQLEALLIGSVSSKVALYSRRRSVWVVDTPVPESNRVLVALQGVEDTRALTDYLAAALAPIPGLHYTFCHIIPPVPPTLWDDGHILGPDERRNRQSLVEKWRSQCQGEMEQVMLEGVQKLAARGVPRDRVEFFITPTNEGIARDLLNHCTARSYQMVVIGKRSFHQKKPFLLGSHANKILQNLKGAVLCLVDES